MKTIYYVLESTGWVQHKRIEYFRELIPDIKFRVISVKNFLRLRSIGLMRKSYFYFASWRSLHPILKEKPNFFKPSDYERFMTSVTSHMNIGGGLDPQKAISFRRPDEAMEIATALLKKYKIVTVNSMALYELLSAKIENIYYCPNGVDIDFYNPDGKKPYDKDEITIGWTGKIRISKNYETIEEAFRQLKEIGFKINEVVVTKDMKQIPLDNHGMAKYYKTIDY
ncbi:MAG: glycosyltransferase, partial [Nitrospirae bacterium]|nr:glycosyltransferase [Nitrospirota bacterium]